ncbi:MAG: hypothetical protein U0Q47_07365 [Mycobacterium sp.]
MDQRTQPPSWVGVLTAGEAMTMVDEQRTAAQRAADRTDSLLADLEERQRAAIESLRKFIDHLDDAVPSLLDDPAARKKVVAAVGDYYEQLAATTTELVGKLVRGALGAAATRDDNGDT